MIENMKVEFGRTSDIDSWMLFLYNTHYPVMCKI